MATVKTVHHGVIIRSDRIIKTISRSSRQELIYELNSWFFDYFYTNRLDILQLPPLDDWERSVEDDSCWFIKFPFDEWMVEIKHELMEFK